jgi:hypothetical protein
LPLRVREANLASGGAATRRRRPTRSRVSAPRPVRPAEAQLPDCSEMKGVVLIAVAHGVCQHVVVTPSSAARLDRLVRDPVRGGELVRAAARPRRRRYRSGASRCRRRWFRNSPRVVASPFELRVAASSPRKPQSSGEIYAFSPQTLGQRVLVNSRSRLCAWASGAEDASRTSLVPPSERRGPWILA